MATPRTGAALLCMAVQADALFAFHPPSRPVNCSLDAPTVGHHAAVAACTAMNARCNSPGIGSVPDTSGTPRLCADANANLKSACVASFDKYVGRTDYPSPTSFGSYRQQCISLLNNECGQTTHDAYLADFCGKTG